MKIFNHAEVSYHLNCFFAARFQRLLFRGSGSTAATAATGSLWNTIRWTPLSDRWRGESSDCCGFGLWWQKDV